MSADQFEREKRYQTMMALCQSLHRKGILSDADLAKAEQLLREKYQPIFVRS